MGAKNRFIVILGIIILSFTGFLAGTVIWGAFASNSNKREVVATVSEKEVKNYGQHGKYLIFTKRDEDVDVYEVEDNLFQGRWNSSDLYGKLEEGKTYKFTVIGIRNNFFSMYPNILNAEEVNAEVIENE